MTDIRNHTKEKEKKGNLSRANRSGLRLIKSEDDASFEKRIHKHRLSFVYRVLLSIAICAAIAAVVALQYQGKVYEDYDVMGTVAMEWADGADMLPLGNGILCYSKDGAHFTDIKGNVLWNQTYEMQSPIVVTGGNVVAIGDYNGRNIYIADSEKQLGTVTTNLPIRNLAVAGNGVVAAVLDDTSMTWIYLYDTAGNVLLYFRTTMRDTGYPVSVSLSPDALLCAVSYVYVDAGSIKSSVAFYNFDEYGKNQIDNLVGGYDFTDTLVPYVQFFGNRAAVAVGDDCLTFYGGTQKPEQLAKYYFEDEVKGVYHGANYLGVVFYNRYGDEQYRLEIFDQKGNRIRTKDFTMDYTDVIFTGDLYIIYSGEKCLISTLNGRTKFDGSFEEPIRLLVPSSTKYRYHIVRQDSMETIQMK